VLGIRSQVDGLLSHAAFLLQREVGSPRKAGLTSSFNRKRELGGQGVSFYHARSSICILRLVSIEISIVCGPLSLIREPHTRAFCTRSTLLTGLLEISAVLVWGFPSSKPIPGVVVAWFFHVFDRVFENRELNHRQILNSVALVAMSAWLLELCLVSFMITFIYCIQVVSRVPFRKCSIDVPHGFTVIECSLIRLRVPRQASIGTPSLRIAGSDGGFPASGSHLYTERMRQEPRLVLDISYELHTHTHKHTCFYDVPAQTQRVDRADFVCKGPGGGGGVWQNLYKNIGEHGAKQRSESRKFCAR